MVDVEFASELLLLAIVGVTNKKDMIDPTYAEYEEEFPGEGEYVGAVETALSLVRSVMSETNKSLIRTRSNFYSVFGACLQYQRTFGRAAFHRSDAVSAGISDILLSAKSADVEAISPAAAEYFEAVSRAASDRGRRVRREEILFHLISHIDANLDIADQTVVTPALLAAGNA